MTATPARPNPLDAIIGAGRLYASVFTAAFPVFLVLEAIKAAVLLALIAALGEDVGATIGWATSTILLYLVIGIAALVAVDAHRGDPPTTTADLYGRAAPLLPGLARCGFAATVVTFVMVFVFIGRFYSMWLAFPMVAVFTVWLCAYTSPTGDGMTERDAAERTRTLAGRAVLPVVALLVFQLFALELVPALADSLVGRKADLSIWVPTESLISALILPIVAMAIANLFVALDEQPEPMVLAPAAPLPGA